MLATIVEWGTLGKAVLYSLVGGVGVTVAFALAIAGATRSYEHGRDGRTARAALNVLLAIVAVLVCAAAIGFGIYFSTTKG